MIPQAQETDQMENRVDHLRTLLANVSSETLTGARLNRVQKQIGELEPAMERVVAANSPVAEELGSTLGPKASRLKEAAAAASIRAERTAEQLEQLDKRLDDSYGQLGQIRTNANELLELTRLSVEKIGQLRRRFETQGPLEISKEELKAEAERKLELIRQLDQSQRESMEVARERLANVTGTLERMGALKGQSEALDRQIGEQRARLVQLNELRGAFQEELNTVRAGLGEVQRVKKTLFNQLNASLLQSLDSNPLFPLQASINGIEKDVAALEKSIAEQKDQLATVSQLLENMAGERTQIDEKVAELGALRTQLPSESGDGRARREVEDRGRLNQKVAQLEAESNKVVGIFDAARLEAHRAVEAANVYQEVCAEWI